MALEQAVSQIERIHRITEMIMQSIEHERDPQELYRQIDNAVMSAYMAGVSYVQMIDTLLNKHPMKESE